MHINFRQGLISFQEGAFLLPSSTSGYVDINVSPTPLVCTIAHGSSDYLLKFDSSVSPAFGPMMAGVDNYLFLEMNTITGALTYGVTVLEPVSAFTAPSTAQAGQMWFDLTEKVFKVRNNENTKWVVSPRVVLGYVENGNVNQLNLLGRGTSVGLNEHGHPGYLMLDSQLRPLRTSTGELLTQDTPVRVKTTVGTSGVLSTPINGFVPVRANEPIPPMRLVYFSGPDAVSLASSNPALIVPRTPVGVLEGGLAQNEVGVVTQSGEIVYDQWNWAAGDIGKPLYCGYNGEITTVRPGGVQAFRVGYIKNSNSVLFYIDSETQAQVLATEGSLVSAIPPLTSSTVTNGIGEIVTTIELPEADGTQDGFLSAANFTVFNSLDGRLTIAESDIVDLDTSKANVLHSHSIPDVSGLGTALTVLTDELSSKTNKAIPITVGSFASLSVSGDLSDSQYSPSSFAAALHVHQISEVTGLQTELNSKADAVHVHLIDDTSGLQDALNNKADFNHTHNITNVSGLQSALDGKADDSHIHAIAGVTGLQDALDNRSIVGHTHSIVQVLNLQDSLDGKIGFTNTTVFTPSADYNPATKKYVDDTVGGAGTALTATRVAFGSPTNTVTGSSKFTWNDTTSTMTLGTTDGSLHIEMPIVATTAAAASFTISGQRNDIGNGGDVVIFGGSAFQNNILYKGGNINLQAGNGTTGGNLTIAAGGGNGSVVGSKGGNTIVRSGGGGAGVASGDTTVTTSAAFPGSIPGTVFIAGATAITTHNSRGGDVVVSGGNSGVSGNTQRAGHVTVAGGLGSTSGNGGDVTIQNGLIAASSSGSPGAVIIRTGDSTHTERLRVSATGEWQIEGDPGSVDQVLSSNGPGAAPTWKVAAGGGYLFQVGSISHPSHYHYAVLSMEQAQTLIQSTDPEVPVADVSQPSVLITSAENYFHQHDVTVYFDYANHTFVATDVSANHDVPHIAFVVADGSGLKAAPLLSTEALYDGDDGFVLGESNQHNKHYRIFSSADFTIVVQEDSVLSVPLGAGGVILIGKHDTGNVTFVAAPGVTINTPDTLTISSLHGKATLIKVGLNEWDIEGNIGAPASLPE